MHLKMAIYRFMAFLEGLIVMIYQLFKSFLYPYRYMPRKELL